MPTDAHEPRLDVSVEGDRTVVRFVNCTSLNEYNADRIGRQLVALGDGKPGKKVTLDLAPIDYLTSTVLGHLVALHKRLAVAGGQLILENCRPTVRNILDITLLDQVLDIKSD
jgi:anti-sigma B factor antagonist